MKVLIIVITILVVSIISFLILRKDCQVSEWKLGSCSKTCGGGKQSKTRKIITNPALGGKKCPNLSEEIDCNTQECPVDCVLGDSLIYMNDCSSLCGTGIRKAKKTVISEAKFGGQCNNPEIETECKIQDCSSTAPISLSLEETVVKPGQSSSLINLFDLSTKFQNNTFIKNIYLSFKYGIINPPTITSNECNSPKLTFYLLQLSPAEPARDPYDNEIISENYLPYSSLTDYNLSIPVNRNLMTVLNTSNYLLLKINSDNCGISLSNLNLQFEYANPLR